MTGRVKNDVGRPTVLSTEEEQVLVSRTLLMATWKFPLTPIGLRHLVKDYLDVQGRSTRFFLLMFQTLFFSSSFIYSSIQLPIQNTSLFFLAVGGSLS